MLTYEKNTRFKVLIVLIVYAIENEAQEVDRRSYEIESSRYKYLSYRNTTSKERRRVLKQDMKHCVMLIWSLKCGTHKRINMSY